MKLNVFFIYICCCCCCCDFEATFKTTQQQHECERAMQFSAIWADRAGEVEESLTSWRCCWKTEIERQRETLRQVSASFGAWVAMAATTTRSDNKHIGKEQTAAGVCHNYWQTDGQTDGQIDWLTDWLIERQTDRQIYSETWHCNVVVVVVVIVVDLHNEMGF